MTPKRRCLAWYSLRLSTALSFLFFLTASAPHRVHHFFDRLANAREHASADHQHGDRRSPGDSAPVAQDCAILSFAQNAHASVVPSFAYARDERLLAFRYDRLGIAPTLLGAAPFSQRAPPLA